MGVCAYLVILCIPLSYITLGVGAASPEPSTCVYGIEPFRTVAILVGSPEAHLPVGTEVQLFVPDLQEAPQALPLSRGFALHSFQQDLVTDIDFNANITIRTPLGDSHTWCMQIGKSVAASSPECPVLVPNGRYRVRAIIQPSDDYLS